MYRGWLFLLSYLIGFRMIVSLASMQILLFQPGHVSGSSGGVCARWCSPSRTTTPSMPSAGQPGKGGQGGNGDSGGCSPPGRASLLGRGQLFRHLSVPWEQLRFRSVPLPSGCCSAAAFWQPDQEPMKEA